MIKKIRENFPYVCESLEGFKEGFASEKKPLVIYEFMHPLPYKFLRFFKQCSSQANIIRRQNRGSVDP
jgi:hypothetical protein